MIDLLVLGVVALVDVLDVDQQELVFAEAFLRLRGEVDVDQVLLNSLDNGFFVLERGKMGAKGIGTLSLPMSREL